MNITVNVEHNIDVQNILDKLSITETIDAVEYLMDSVSTDDIVEYLKINRSYDEVFDCYNDDYIIDYLEQKGYKIE